jgi:hypothetical protein
VVERFIGHYPLAQALRYRIFRLGVKSREGAHGEAVDQHFHVGQFFPIEQGADKFVAKIAQGSNNGNGLLRGFD